MKPLAEQLCVVVVVETPPQGTVLDEELDRELDRVAEARESSDVPVRGRVELEPVVADHLDPVHADEPPGVVACPATHAGHQQVPAREPPQLRLRFLRNLGKLGAGDDRRENAVHVEQDRRPLGSLDERGEQRVERAVGRHHGS